jgi:EpsI family protein
MRKPLDIIVAALLATAAIVLFRGPLSAMVALWDVSPMYSYGYTVPPISAFLLWSRQDDFRRHAISPSRGWGAVVMVGAVAALAVGHLAAVQVVQQLGFIILIAGLVLYLFGRAHLKIAAPALAYLLFMVPMWDFFTEPLHWPFQNNSAQLGVAIIHGLGIPVHREGTLITLPNVVLEVARECSGINYLIAVTALALPLALLRLRQTWRRIVLIAASLAMAAVANALRISLIGTLAYLEIGSPLHGPLHVLHGLFVAAAGYVVLFSGLHMLRERDDHRAPAAAAPPVAVGSWRLGEAGGLTAVLLALAFVGVIPSAQDSVLAHPDDALPARVSQWRVSETVAGSRRKDSSFAAMWPNAQQIRRQYHSPSGQIVIVEIFYYGSQSQDGEVVNSMSASLHQRSSRTTIETSRGAFTANLVEWPASAESALFWYDVNGQPLAGELSTKLSTMWRAVRSGRTNGAVVVLRTRTTPAARTALIELAGALKPALAGLVSPVTD